MKRQKGEKVKRLMPLYLFASLPLYLLTFSPFLVGCAAMRQGPPVTGDLTGLSWMLRRPSGTVQNLSLEQIKDTLSSNNTSFTTLKAKAQITVDMPDTSSPLLCDGYIRLQRPNKLRFIGTKLTSTIFDMLTDGETFWLYLPSEKKIYTGKCNSISASGGSAKLGVNILPDDIAMLLNYNDALTPGTILTKDVSNIPILETWPGLWLIHIVDLNNGTAILRANLYIDRVGVNVIRYDIFGTGGNIRVQAFFDDYARFDNSVIPQRIVILWPDDDTKLILSLTNIVTNEQIDPKVFRFFKPKSAEIISLDDLVDNEVLPR